MTETETAPQPVSHRPSGSDPAVPDNLASASPGALTTPASLVIHTVHAQRLVQGRSKSKEHAPIVGLIRFGWKMNLLWHAAKADDPYADWFLLRTHDVLQQVNKDLVDQQRSILAQMQCHSAVEIGVGRTKEVIRVPLNFGNPYGYMAAYLLGDFDNLIRTVLTMMHVGIQPRSAGYALIEKSSSAVRRVFYEPFGWKNVSLTREDLRQGNQRALQAEKVMGPLPVEILEGTRRAPFAPPLAQKTIVSKTKAVRKKTAVGP